MIDPVSTIKQSIELSRTHSQRKTEELLAPRLVAAKILKNKLENDLMSYGTNIHDPVIQKWIFNFLDMYILLAWPLDRFPDWQDEGIPHEKGADFLSEWMENSLKVLRNISPALSK